MNMTGTPPTDDDTNRKSKPIDAADLLDESGRVDISKVKSRAKTTNDESTSVGDELCHDMRVAAQEVESMTEIFDDFAPSIHTIRRHVRGDCSCQPVADPVRMRQGSGPIPAATCDEMRRRVAAGDIGSTTPLVEDYDFCKTSVNFHLNGNCTHETTEPPCEYVDGRWRVAADSETDDADSDGGDA